MARTDRGPGPGEGPWDPGLQPERTALAWNRTVMSLLVAEIALARWTAGGSFVLAVLVFVVSVPGTLYVLTFLGRRQRRTLAHLRADEPLRDTSRLAVVLTSVVVLTGVLELVHVLVP